MREHRAHSCVVTASGCAGRDGNSRDDVSVTHRTEASARHQQLVKADFALCVQPVSAGSYLSCCHLSGWLQSAIRTQLDSSMSLTSCQVIML